MPSIKPIVVIFIQAPGANDELNICLKLVVLLSNTRLLAA